MRKGVKENEAHDELTALFDNAKPSEQREAEALEEQKLVLPLMLEKHLANSKAIELTTKAANEYGYVPPVLHIKRKAAHNRDGKRIKTRSTRIKRRSTRKYKK